RSSDLSGVAVRAKIIVVAARTHLRVGLGDRRVILHEREIMVGPARVLPARQQLGRGRVVADAGQQAAVGAGWMAGPAAIAGLLAVMADQAVGLLGQLGHGRASNLAHVAVAARAIGPTREVVLVR